MEGRILLSNNFDLTFSSALNIFLSIENVCNLLDQNQIYLGRYIIELSLLDSCFL